MLQAPEESVSRAKPRAKSWRRGPFPMALLEDQLSGHGGAHATFVLLWAGDVPDVESW